MSFKSTALLIFLLSLFMRCFTVEDANNYLRNACAATQYPEVCFKTLSRIPNTAKRNASGLARAAISLSLTEAKNVSMYILSLRQQGLKGRASTALADCIECFSDALDNLHKSLFEIRALNRNIFELQVNNMQTWMSAALTSEDTCLDGFSDYGGTLLDEINSTVGNVARMTSNALSLISTLASTGGQSLVNP